MLKRIFFMAVFGSITFAPAYAEFLQVDLEKVPVARLIENLEKSAKDKPKDAGNLVNLARTYAMAYSQKTDELQVSKRQPNIPWFGYAPIQVPFAKVQKTEDKEKLKAAAVHLDNAIKWYEAAIKLDPKNNTARIGLAWAIEQSGKTEDAVKLYRKLIEDSWDQGEKDLRSLGITGETITTEAGGYLIALLDPEKDKEEISALKERIAKLKKLPRPITPIAVPLQDGLTATDIENRNAAVTFDADGSGWKRQWTWIRPNAAWLVYDPKAKGDIGSGLQLFGNVTFRLFWSNGYEALSSLDNNRDGELRGDELNGLALWHDANGNGIVDVGEVKPLAEHGIVAISCRWETMNEHPDRIAFSIRGVTLKDGKTRPTYDVILKSK